MFAMIAKEFRQMRRDRRTVALMILMPALLLLVFGYAASFDVATIRTAVGGSLADQTAAHDRNIHRSFPHVMPRSLGTMRRKV